MLQINELEEKAYTIRKNLLNFIYRIGMGHLGGELSLVEVAVALYYRFMNYDPTNPKMTDRDRLILSKGHCSETLYTIFSDLGMYSMDYMVEHFETLNTSVWHKGHNALHAEEPQIYVAHKAYPKNENGVSCLVLEVKDTVYFHNGTRYNYVSGEILSNQLYRYGYFEMRCHIPAGQGFFPAFWLWMSSKEDETPCWYNEIDIFEMTGCKPNVTTNNVHYKFTCPPENGGNEYKEQPCNYSDGYHWYGLEWTPEKIIWYLDHKVIREEDNIGWFGELDNKQGIQHAMRLIINFALKPLNDKCPPDETTPLPAHMYIDKVNVYQLKTEDCDVPVYEIPNFNTFRYGVKQSITLTSASTLPPQSDITLRVRDFVELKNDFTIPAGTEFCIIPSSCYENDIE